MSLLDRAVVTLLPAVPRSVVRQLSAPLHRRPDARRRAPRRRRLNAAGKLATVDVLGEEVAHDAEADGDRGRVRRRARGDRAGRPRRERQRQADRARAEARLRPLPRNVEAVIAAARADEPVRPDRHGGLVHDRRHARALPRAARRGARERRAGPPGVAQADASTDAAALAGAERPALQGDLRRARVDPVPRRRGGPGQLRPVASRRCSTAAATRRSRRTTSG